MSIFKSVAAAAETVLLESNSTSNTFDINVETMSITNCGSTDTSIDVHIKPLSGSNHSVFKATIPAYVTLVYNTKFSFPHDSKLQILPGNSNTLNITIN